MKSDEQLLAELRVFAGKFTSQYSLFSYKDGHYANGLGDFNIDDKDWKNSEVLRDAFNHWISDNGFLIENTQLDISFDPPSIKVVFGFWSGKRD
jgi:hypothetical protein